MSTPANLYEAMKPHTENQYCHNRYSAHPYAAGRPADFGEDKTKSRL